MNRILYFLIINCWVFFNSSISFSQKSYELYYRLINKAKVSVSYDSIEYYYNKAFKIEKPYFEDVIDFAGISYSNNKVETSKDLLKLAVTLGFQYKPEKKNRIIDYTRFARDTMSDFGKFKHDYLSPIYDSLRAVYIDQCAEYEDDLFEILLINEAFYQNVRGRILSDKSTRKKLNMKLQSKLAKPNLYLFFEFLRNGNFPNRRKTRHFSTYSITPILIHASAGLPESESKEFFELLFDQVLNGNIMPYEYCMVYDMYYTRFIDKPYRKATFGTILTNGKIDDVQFPLKLNELREQYFLITIEKFAELYGYKLPENYGK